MLKLEATIVGGPNIKGRYFEAIIITEGEYKGLGIDLPFEGARKMGYKDPANPFITRDETRWKLNPDDSIMALVKEEDLRGEVIVSFAWGPSAVNIGEELPLKKVTVKKPMAQKPAPAKTSAPASKPQVSKSEAQAYRKVGTIYLPEPALRKSPLGHVSVIDTTDGHQAWCGPLNPEKFPAGLIGDHYRYFTWTLSRKGETSKVEITDPLKIKIEIAEAIAPVVVPAKTESKKPTAVEVNDEPAPKKKPKSKGKRRVKRVNHEDETEIVKNSGPKVAPAPTQPRTANTSKAASQKSVATKPAKPTTVNPVFRHSDKARYRVLGPNREQIDMGKLSDLVIRAADLLEKRKEVPVLGDNVILEQEQGPGTGFFLRCESNIVRDGVQPMIEAIASSDAEDAAKAAEAPKTETPVQAQLATA